MGIFNKDKGKNKRVRNKKRKEEDCCEKDEVQAKGKTDKDTTTKPQSKTKKSKEKAPPFTGQFVTLFETHTEKVEVCQITNLGCIVSRNGDMVFVPGAKLKGDILV